ncbi:MAG: SAM-dependent methyltransferase, partial [Geodermatophilaceae bacterium]|nr:SAM-dependent methyltransferase [Geodermatophilaceae bacterium]
YDDRVDWVAQLAEATANAARVSLRAPNIPELTELFGPGERREFPHVQQVTHDGLRDLVQTHSGYLVADAGRRAELLADVDRVLAEHPDLRGLTQLDVPYETLSWRAERL